MKTAIFLALVPALTIALPASSVSSAFPSSSVAPSSSAIAAQAGYTRPPHKEEACPDLAFGGDRAGGIEHRKGTYGKQDGRPWVKPKNVTEGHGKPNRPTFEKPQNGTHGHGQHNENGGRHDGEEKDGKDQWQHRDGQHDGGDHHGPPGKAGHHGRSDEGDTEPDVDVKVTLWVRLISWLTGKPKAEIVNTDAQLQDGAKGHGDGKNNEGKPKDFCDRDDIDCEVGIHMPDHPRNNGEPCDETSSSSDHAVTIFSGPAGAGPTPVNTTTYHPEPASSNKKSSSSSSHLPRPTGPAGWAHGGPWSPTANPTLAKATSSTLVKPSESAQPHAGNGGDLQFGHPHGGPKSSPTTSFISPFPTTHGATLVNSSTSAMGSTSSVSKWAQPSQLGKPIWQAHPNNHTQIVPAPGQPLKPRTSKSTEPPTLTNTQPPKPLGPTLVPEPTSSSSTFSTLAKPTNLPFMTDSQPPKPLGQTLVPLPSSSSSTSSSVTKPVAASGHFSPAVITPSGQSTPILPTTTSSSGSKPSFTKDQVGAVPTGPNENEIDEGDLEG